MSNALNNVFKLSSVINVTEPRWGAKGDGATDDYAAIQAAINANPGKTIYLPAGSYRLTQKLYITSAGTRLVGDWPVTYLIAAGANADCVHFENPALDGSFLSNCGVQGLYFTRNTAATLGAGLRLTRCSNFDASEFFVLNMPEGVRVEGGQLNTLSRFRLFASGSTFDLSATPNSSAIRFSQAPLTVGFQPCYTITVSEFFIGGSKKWQCSILVANGDGLDFSHGYTAGASAAELRFNQDRNASYISPATFTSVYFDGVNTSTGATNCLHIPADGFTADIRNIVFTACTFGQPTSTIALIRKACRVEFVGCSFINGLGWGVDAEAANMHLTFTGGRFTNLGQSAGATGGLRFASGQSLVVNGTAFTEDSGTVGSIRLEGTIGSVALSGATFRSTAADLSSTATISDFTRSGNIKGTFSPTVRFGGASVGITYGTREGNFTRDGDRVFFDIDIVLTSKGSSTGNMDIDGLPYPAAKNCALAVRVSALTSGVGDTFLQGTTQATGSAIRLDKITTGSAIQLTDADITNTSRIQVSGHYRV